MLTIKTQGMKFYFAALIIFAATFFTGCVSSVSPAGPDTYYISKGPLPIWMSGAKAKADCYQEANKWRTKRGLTMVPVSSDFKDPIPGRAGNAELTFRALKPGDPEIQRPIIESLDTTKRIQVR